jgi:hypothetical protein
MRFGQNLGKSTSGPQRAQTKIAKDEDASGCASTLCLNKGKTLSKYVKTGNPVKR